MRLGEYLQLADISQTRFAALIGVRQATVSRYISGTKIPSATVALKIRQLSQGERTDPFRSAVPIDPDQWFRLIPITDSG